MKTKAPVVPTKDLERAANDLKVHGYALIADDLNQSQIDAMIERIGEQAIAEARLRGETLSLDEEYLRVDIGGLLNKGKIFQTLLDVHSPLHRLVDRSLTPTVSAAIAKEHGLEQRFILSSVNATFKRRERMPEAAHAKEGHYALLFHIDQAFMPIHTPFPVALNSFRCLTDYTYENGATMVIPGTHESAPPDWGTFSGEGAIPVEAPAGTCIVVDGRIWHAGGMNINGKLRASITAYYGAPWVRQTWSMPLNLRQEVVDALSDDQLKLCGFDTMFQSAYGAFVGPNIIEPLLGRSNVSNKIPAIGELHLS